jgi:hypothetical protein
MSDGQNTSQYYLRDGYKTGPTNVWYYEGDYDNDGDIDRVYSVKDGSEYYYKRPSSWNSYYQAYTSDTWMSPQHGSEPFMGNASTRLSYPELFHQASNEWISDALFDDIWSDSYADNFWRYNAYDYVSGSTKDNRMDDICDAAKSSGIIIFTIGFEAPSHGEAVLENCASSQGHFFDVDGIEISDAFEAIATSISKLRLTQ